MSNYIDADKLKAEIERRKEKWLAASRLIKKGKDKAMYAAGKSSGYTEFFSLIASLQQEQTEPTCKTCGFYENNCPFIRGKLMVYPNYVCKDYTYSEVKAQEQPEVDLEKEYKTWWNSISGKINVEHIMEWYMHETARHFYELGLNARKEE